MRSLEFTSREEYLSAERHKWYVDGELAGYVKKGGNLTEIMVRGAGHNVPLYVPRQAFDLIYRITRNDLPWSGGPSSTTQLSLHPVRMSVMSEKKQIYRARVVFHE
uniref:(California timema) hypothetical protein n=1 Tax=Timema californicum TaxID=61474 RepID=A0A7R9JJ72_TIMCA|nr:unnamed protein product [Timema californicum]